MRQIHVWDKPIELFCAVILIAERTGGFNDVWKVYKPDIMPLGPDTDLNTSAFQFDIPNWCASRVLSIDRKYAKQIYMLLALPQTDSYNAKATIAITFRCVSLLDSYWVLYGDDEAQWEEINQSDSKYRVARKSYVIILYTFTGFDRTAEVSTIGTFPKGWYRNEAGILWMYKANGDMGNEVINDVCASNVIASENGFTLKEAASHYFQHAELKLLITPTRGMFPSQEAHDVFWKRYKQLGF